MAKILIIEDNPMNLELAGELLKSNGHDTIYAENAVEGIKLAKTKSPNLILMDMSLPQMDGLTATKILKQDPLTESIPIVAFTALVMNTDKQKAFGAGCSGFIPKPINVLNFAETIEQYLEDNGPEEKIALDAEKQIEQLLSKQDNRQKEPHNRQYSWHKVLIVDDNPMNSELLKETLEQIGQSSIIAYNGRNALEIVNKERFDLILLDIMMPGMSGYEVIQQLKANEKTAEIPVIFISALNETRDIVKGFDLGSYGYITKPYNIEELKAKVLSTLRIKDLQDQLKRETRKLELISRFSADGIVILNSSLEITSCNNLFAAWFDKSKEEITGNSFCKIVHNTEIQDNECSVAEKIKNGFLDGNQSINKDFVIEVSNKKRILQANFSKITDDNSEIEGFIAVIRDITAYKEIENQKETFVATLTHDLKTPIRAETMALELLLKGTFGELNPEQKDILKDTLYSSKYMFAMIDNLLATYKYENGQVILNQDDININQLITSCYSELKHLADEKNHEITFNFKEEVLNIQVDSLETKRVIMNLLANAISYTPENGKILIKTEFSDNKIKVSVTDNGKGIPQSDIPKLFNKYSSSSKRFRQVGTGLGLYLCKQIINAHNGEILVDSEEGRGSTFTVIIPITHDNSLTG